MHETNAVYGTITPKAQTERKSTEIVEKKKRDIRRRELWK